RVRPRATVDDAMVSCFSWAVFTVSVLSSTKARKCPLFDSVLIILSITLIIAQVAIFASASSTTQNVSAYLTNQSVPQHRQLHGKTANSISAWAESTQPTLLGQLSAKHLQLNSSSKARKSLSLPTISTQNAVTMVSTEKSNLSASSPKKNATH
ncbi:hypothetical protein XK24_09270, partial [Streptococcus suis]